MESKVVANPIVFCLTVYSFNFRSSSEKKRHYSQKSDILGSKIKGPNSKKLYATREMTDIGVSSCQVLSEYIKTVQIISWI